MAFQLSPILDTMIGLYSKPRSLERFNEYLKILKGDTIDDMVVPIGNYNPMGKEHLLERLMELKTLNAETIAEETLSEINKKIEKEMKAEFNVYLSVGDDLHGGWTNRFVTDYDSKFRINALIKRNFCTPLFFTSEPFTPELIRKRTLEYALRTLYRMKAEEPLTLKDHIEQEKFIAQKSNKDPLAPECDFESLHAFYNRHQEKEQHDVIFNFLFGDDASMQLGYPAHGIKEAFAGFRYAERLNFI
jgi:hypothetical protein